MKLLGLSLKQTCIALFCFLISFICTLAYGTEDTTTFEIPSGFESQNILPYARYWEEKTDNLSLREIIKTHSDKFHGVKSTNFERGYDSDPVWLSFQVKNKSSVEDLFYLEVKYPLLDFVDFHEVSSDGAIKSVFTGDQRPFSTRPLNTRTFVFPLNLKPEESKTIFFRIKTNGSMSAPIKIHTRKYFIGKNIEETVLIGALFGSLIVMFCYNSILYFSTQDKTYLYYVCFIFCLGMSLAVLSGVAFQFFWNNYPTFGNVIIGFLLSQAAGWICYSSRNYLETKRYAPRSDKLLRTLSIVSFSSSFVTLILGYTYSIYLSTLMLFLSATCLVIGTWFWIKGIARTAPYYVLSWSFFAAGMIVLYLKTLGFLPANPITEWAHVGGTVLQVVILSLGLAKRINHMSDEQLKAEKNVFENNIEATRKTKQMESERKRQALVAERVRLQELGRIAIYTGDKVNNPLAVMLLCLEELEALVSENNDSSLLSVASLMEVEADILLIKKELAALAPYKEYAPKNSLGVPS